MLVVVGTILAHDSQVIFFYIFLIGFVVGGRSAYGSALCMQMSGMELTSVHSYL